jgi:hypothetical protein
MSILTQTGRRMTFTREPTVILLSIAGLLEFWLNAGRSGLS